MTKKHSRIGASSADRWISCPGSVPLSDLAPTPPTSVYAEEGTAAHALAEKCLVLGATPEQYLGQKIKGFTVTEEMAGCVREYIEDIESIDDFDEYGIETRINLSFIDKDLFGTSDYYKAKLGDTLYIHDYKHGAGVPVEAENNRQLMYYAAGVASIYDFNFKRYVATIVQPRAPHDLGGIRRYEFDQERMSEFLEEIKTAVGRIREAREVASKELEDKFLKAGKWCRWCPAKSICPALRKGVVEVTMPKFEPVPDDILDIKPTPIDHLSPERIAKVLALADVVETWLDGVRSHAKNELTAGRKIPGYKLVEKRGHRKWKDPVKAASTLAFLGLDEKQIMHDPELKSPAQIEKIKGVNKKFVNNLTVTPNIGVSMVRENNAKDAVDPPALSVFEAYEG